MNKIDMLKKGAQIVTTIGVGILISNAVKATTPDGVRRITKLCIEVGVFAISGAIAKAACKYTDKSIDELVDLVKGMVKEDTEEEYETDEETEEATDAEEE